MATFWCVSCGHEQLVAVEQIGKFAKCPKCRKGGAKKEAAPSTRHSQLDDSIEDVFSKTEPDERTLVLKGSGGSVMTHLGYGITLNRESSLVREWITICDPILPARLVGHVGVATVFEKDADPSLGEYVYVTKFAVKAKQALVAIETRFLLFDLWDRHVRTLSSSEISDMPAGSTKEIYGKWQLESEIECAEHYASIAYIAQVRTAMGRVIVADTERILSEAKEVSERCTESDLEPTPICR